MILSYDAPIAETTGKTSANEDVVDVCFTQIELNRRIVQVVDFQSDDPAFSGPMTMTWTLTPADGGTEVRIVAENVPEGISEADHAEGLRSSLDNLGRFVAPYVNLIRWRGRPNRAMFLPDVGRLQIDAQEMRSPHAAKTAERSRPLGTRPRPPGRPCRAIQDTRYSVATYFAARSRSVPWTRTAQSKTGSHLPDDGTVTAVCGNGGVIG